MATPSRGENALGRLDALAAVAQPRNLLGRQPEAAHVGAIRGPLTAADREQLRHAALDAREVLEHLDDRPATVRWGPAPPRLGHAREALDEPRPLDRQ